MKRILVVDDHPLVRIGLVQLLSSLPDVEVCGQSCEAAEALAITREKSPDLAIIDLTLARGSGFELVRSLRERLPSIAVLVCSVHAESIYAQRALAAGASGYLSKLASPDEIVTAVRRVLDGGIWLSGRQTSDLLRRTAEGATQGSSLSTLTNREVEIMEAIGRGMTTRQIADTFHLSVRTIESHRQRMRAKLGLDNTSQLTRQAVEYVLDANALGG